MFQSTRAINHLTRLNLFSTGTSRKHLYVCVPSCNFTDSISLGIFIALGGTFYSSVLVGFHWSLHVACVLYMKSIKMQIRPGHFKARKLSLKKVWALNIMHKINITKKVERLKDKVKRVYKVSVPLSSLWNAGDPYSGAPRKRGVRADPGRVSGRGEAAVDGPPDGASLACPARTAAPPAPRPRNLPRLPETSPPSSGRSATNIRKLWDRKPPGFAMVSGVRHIRRRHCHQDYRSSRDKRLIINGSLEPWWAFQKAGVLLDF